MTALSDRLTVTASRLIRKYGGTATLTRRVAGTFNPATQTETSGSTSTDTVKAVIEDFRAHEIDGDVIRYGDKKILLTKSDLQNLVVPKPDDIISMSGETYRIVEVFGISAGDAFVGYSVQARK